MGRKKKKSKGAIKREKEQTKKLEAQQKAAEEKRKAEALARGEDPAELERKRLAKKNKTNEPEFEIGQGMEDNEEYVKEWIRDIRCPNITVAPIGGGKPLIRGCDLTLIHGRRYGLIGKNGAGKTTLLTNIENKNFLNFPEYLRVHSVCQEMEGTDLTVLETVQASDVELTALVHEKRDKMAIVERPDKILLQAHLDKIHQAETLRNESPTVKKKASTKGVKLSVGDAVSTSICGMKIQGNLIAVLEDGTVTVQNEAQEFTIPVANVTKIEKYAPGEVVFGLMQQEWLFGVVVRCTGVDALIQVDDNQFTIVLENTRSIDEFKAMEPQNTAAILQSPEYLAAVAAADEIDGNRLITIDERLTYLEAEQAEFRASTVLDGLNFTDRMKNMKTSDLSGGWRMRVALACGLFIEPDVLLLDEPTNHLDMPAVMWLIEYLQCYNEEKSLIIVSHEREFMNEVCTDIIHLTQCRLVYYGGNYEQFRKTKREQEHHQATQYKKQQHRIAHEEDFIRRFAANKKWSKQAQSRRKALDKLKRVGKVHSERSFSFRFPKPEKLKNDHIIEIEDLAFGYFGRDKSQKTYLLTDVTKRIAMGSKVGIIGANGAGKSTLLKLIMRELDPIEGKCFMRNEVVYGYFAQHHMDVIDGEATPLQYLRYKYPGTSVEQCYRKLGQFAITHKNANEPISTLSGGEKSRLAFSILTWYRPQLVIMDEPTNHLDIGTQDALIEALQNFEGGLLVVSHDKHMLTSVCDEFWVVGNRTVTAFEDFGRATTFCYKKCKPVDVLPREFSTVAAKTKEKIPAKMKSFQPGDSAAAVRDVEATQFVVDCERELEKGFAKNLDPIKIVKHLEDWEPVDGVTGPLYKLSFYMFGKYFTDLNMELDLIDFLESFQPIANKIIPIHHIQNQINMINVAVSCWFTNREDGFEKACEEGVLEEMFDCFYNFQYVCDEGLIRWRENDDNAVGREAAVAETADWFEQLELPSLAEFESIQIAELKENEDMMENEFVMDEESMI